MGRRTEMADSTSYPVKPPFDSLPTDQMIEALEKARKAVEKHGITAEANTYIEKLIRELKRRGCDVLPW